MEIKLTNEEAEQFFHTALCNGLGQLANYGIVVRFNSDDYQKAKDSLKEGSNAICYEDVLLRVLKQGNKLVFTDGVDAVEDVEVTLQKVHEQVPKCKPDILMQFHEEQDDADTADVLLQTLLYNEIIFG